MGRNLYNIGISEHEGKYWASVFPIPYEKGNAKTTIESYHKTFPCLTRKSAKEIAARMNDYYKRKGISL